jgi:hypothetical protein
MRPLNKKLKVAMLYALISAAMVMIDMLRPGAEPVICRPARQTPGEE